MNETRILADGTHADRITLTGERVTASTERRTLGGEVVRFGVVGRTSRGPLRVRAGALRFPDDLTAVKLTREHVLTDVRGHLVTLDVNDQRIRASFRVSDGGDGDAALTEANDHTRDYLSYDIVDATIQGDEIVDALVIAVAQTGVPAYAGSRIDSVAASAATGNTNTEGTPTMTEVQRARLAELRAASNLTPEQQSEMEALAALETASDAADDASGDQSGDASGDQPGDAQAGQSVAASMQPIVPGGTPTGGGATTRPRDTLQQFVRAIVDGYAANSPARITAALADVTYTAHSGNVTAPGWSGELWSGSAYEPIWAPLLGSGDLTGPKGVGWRWVVKPEMQDYVGDKAPVPTNTLDTESAEYTAARMAVGHDFDRAFYDFPNDAFLRSYLDALPESWKVKLDAKVEAWIIANGIPATIGGVAVPSQPSVFHAVAKGMRALRRNLAGRGTFVVLSDDDYDSLMDVTNFDIPAYLAMFGVTPEMFTPSALQADGTVTVGVRQSASVLTLPGSPLRATAQHIANGGIDEAFFGYWAIQQHHSKGIVDVSWAPVP